MHLLECTCSNYVSRAQLSHRTDHDASANASNGTVYYYRGRDTKQKVGGGLTYMGCNCVHVSMLARGVWRHAPPGNFLHIRSSEVHSDAF